MSLTAVLDVGVDHLFVKLTQCASLGAVVHTTFALKDCDGDSFIGVLEQSSKHAARWTCSDDGNLESHFGC